MTYLFSTALSFVFGNSVSIEVLSSSYPQPEPLLTILTSFLTYRYLEVGIFILTFSEHCATAKALQGQRLGIDAVHWLRSIQAGVASFHHDSSGGEYITNFMGFSGILTGFIGI